MQAANNELLCFTAEIIKRLSRSELSTLKQTVRFLGLALLHPCSLFLLFCLSSTCPQREVRSLSSFIVSTFYIFLALLSEDKEENRNTAEYQEKQVVDGFYTHPSSAARPGALAGPLRPQSSTQEQDMERKSFQNLLSNYRGKPPKVM